LLGIFYRRCAAQHYAARAHGTATDIAALISQLPQKGVTTMRKVGDSWPDQRLIELVAVIAVTILIGAGVRYLNEPAPAIHASFIVPSQTVHW
jgi:hypothetical protein